MRSNFENPSFQQPFSGGTQQNLSPGLGKKTSSPPNVNNQSPPYSMEKNIHLTKAHDLAHATSHHNHHQRKH